MSRATNRYDCAKEQMITFYKSTKFLNKEVELSDEQIARYADIFLAIIADVIMNGDANPHPDINWKAKEDLLAMPHTVHSWIH